jgi:CheY-like chemotaxis protein
MHGGTASVDSPGIGHGARFTIRLPLDDRADAPAPATARRAKGNGGQRVLVIEDNVDAAEMLRVLLELNDHTVALAFSGPEGIEKARGFAPDVVLCDIGLPGMNGYEVAQTIRQDPALRGARLVALTGYAGSDDIARARHAGFDAHVPKPPSREKLEEILTRGHTERDDM